jgi:hypothetical protein
VNVIAITTKRRRNRDLRRRVEASMREALEYLVAGLNDTIEIEEAVHGANRALAGAVVIVCRERVS